MNMGWTQDRVRPKARRWEEFYRNRGQQDNVVRSTHGVNCTGGCSWAVYVKDGIITWEMQQTDYPLLETGLPPYEPRGCQRGISASWYVYSPIRVKYPYVRGALLDLWREARERLGDAVDGWGLVRVFGFSPIPAMSYLSYAGGSRFLQLFGGVNMSFYDWYADLPNAFP